jgi:hypothetical protein
MCLLFPKKKDHWRREHWLPSAWSSLVCKTKSIIRVIPMIFLRFIDALHPILYFELSLSDIAQHAMKTAAVS